MRQATPDAAPAENAGISFVLNDGVVRTDAPGGMTALDYLRGTKRLTGTKEGCREGDCGACTILLGKPAGDTITYNAVTSCLLPLAELSGRHIVTVEGINSDENLNPIQKALVDEGAIQCGFCTPGIVMAITGCFLESANLDEADVIAAIEGNLCRCTGYVSVKRAATRVVRELRDSIAGKEGRIPILIEAGVLPPFFRDIPATLKSCGLDDGFTGPPREEAPLVAGGTDLYVQEGDQLADSPVRLLSRETELAGIREEEGFLSLGAATTVEEMRGSDLVEAVIPGFRSATRLISSQLIRRRATVGGNIANASPIGDLTIILLALHAELRLQLNDDARDIPLHQFFKGYKQLNLREGEIIARVRIPLTRRDYRFSFEKVSRREYLDIASVNSVISIKCDGATLVDAALSAGGVGPVPMFLAKTAEYMKDKTISREMVLATAEIADREISPISDVRGSDSYKRLLLRQLILAHFVKLFPEMGVV